MNVNTVDFADIIKEMRRGQFAERYVSGGENDKPCEYLRLADIGDGVIAENCVEIVFDSRRFKNYQIKNGDIVLSQAERNYKVVCAENMDNRTLVVSANLIRIELDTDKADPYYIAAYLSSEEGRKNLSGYYKGKILKLINIKELKECRIPLPPMEEQKKTGEKYRHHLERIRALKAEIDGLYEDIQLLR